MRGIAIKEDDVTYMQGELDISSKVTSLGSRPKVSFAPFCRTTQAVRGLGVPAGRASTA